jgi:hypothetical protein
MRPSPVPSPRRFPPPKPPLPLLTVRLNVPGPHNRTDPAPFLIPIRAQQIPIRAQQIPIRAQQIPIRAQQIPIRAQQIPIRAQQCPAILHRLSRRSSHRTPFHRPVLFRNPSRQGHLRLPLTTTSHEFMRRDLQKVEQTVSLGGQHSFHLSMSSNFAVWDVENGAINEPRIK